ncbi:threonine--tRNA ligase [Candidatus Nitrosacidococcus sp. I8]|uniref:threonine--tRNA ligase n=1 Tax=Candidatus Nitrosacidococcus sp. I8 TaxID=2942908 RepID=UPI0022269C78|nr:threonine--tRNA ligase [Candidatus Nitrosacidococcus sp. I8]CAH9018620.1 Threonine--tRNA ligase [Candidatus Nitrosacidococcus sp. I8]
MPVITLPDGSQRQFDHPVTVYDVATNISENLAKAALGGKTPKGLVDTSYCIKEDIALSIITDRDPEGLEIIRHSCAHLLAQAVKQLYPEAQVTIGPVIEDGFYYDFVYPKGFTLEDLQIIEDRMKVLSDQDISVHRQVKSRNDAVSFFHDLGEEYKAKIIESIPEDQELSLYQQGDFTDLCRGPHVPSTSKIKAFKLTKVSGAYWRGDARNEMLQRIYGTAWSDKKALKTYLHRIEEAEKRDHRKIGTELDLFSIQEDAGGGLVFWHPMGARIRRTVEDLWRERHAASGYETLYTPHIAHENLWHISGHTSFYRESMYQPMEDDNQFYQLKPMNCPFHVLIYKGRLRSYREFPLRWAELGTVYRHEMSGALHGLMRVRGFTQDDAHIFCREGQIESEVLAILDFTLDMLKTFGFNQYEIELSTRPENSVGSDEIWDRATQALRSALEKKGLSYGIDEGGGAFYGPKIDIKIEDAIGRKWQCSTVQLDFNLPNRFEMEYIAEDGTRQRPIMIHRAVLGSLERFFGILIEHFAGKFPPWLAPVQVVVINITDRQTDYAEQVEQILKKQGFRSTLDLRNEKIGFKIREHTLKRIPYLLIVGDKEVTEQQVAVRTRSGKDLGAMSLDSFSEYLKAQIARFSYDISEED